MTEFKDIEIIGQDHKGRGIAKIDEKVIFVDRTLPGEVCDIEITKENKKFLEAKAVSFKKNLKEEVICPYYDKCGGCDILHQKYNEQLKFKESKLKDILKKFAGIDIKLNDIVFDEQFYYRNKITLHNLGLFQRKSKTPVMIDNCMLVHPKINEIIKRLQEYSKCSNNIMDEVMIRVSNQDEVLLSVVGKITKKRFLSAFSDITVIVINNQVFTDKDYITDKIHDKVFKISSKSFYQVNRYVTEKLYDEVVEFYKNNNHSKVLDLYCGTGTISLLVAPFVDYVTGIEIVSDAVINANDNKELNKVNNVEFINGKVEDYIDKFTNIDGIIVDPPRSGLDNKTIGNILKISPKSIVYVSCDPITLARDLNILKDVYDIISVTPVDMFPNTYHVESVSILKLRENIEL